MRGDLGNIGFEGRRLDANPARLIARCLTNGSGHPH